MVKSQPFVRYFWRAIPAVALATLLSACTTPSQPTALTTQQGAHQRTGFLHQTSQDEFEEMVYNVDVKSKIMNQYARWKGVRYRMGGETRRGIDCSAFVQRTFREQFGLDLPRSTSHQKDSGNFIMRTKLRAGDLVLFRSGSTGRHIGIYVGNDNFVHASASSGVMISNLNDSYWKNRYREARRVLNYPHS